MPGSVAKKKIPAEQVAKTVQLKSALVDFCKESKKDDVFGLGDASHS